MSGSPSTIISPITYSVSTVKPVSGSEGFLVTKRRPEEHLSRMTKTDGFGGGTMKDTGSSSKNTRIF
jgi:hypothetical protein